MLSAAGQATLATPERAREQPVEAFLAELTTPMLPAPGDMTRRPCRNKVTFSPQRHSVRLASKARRNSRLETIAQEILANNFGVLDDNKKLDACIKSLPRGCEDHSNFGGEGRLQVDPPWREEEVIHGRTGLKSNFDVKMPVPLPMYWRRHRSDRNEVVPNLSSMEACSALIISSCFCHLSWLCFRDVRLCLPSSHNPLGFNELLVAACLLLCLSKTALFSTGM